MITEDDIDLINLNHLGINIKLFSTFLFHGEYFTDSDDEGWEFSMNGCRLDVCTHDMKKEDFVKRFNHMLTYKDFKRNLFNCIFEEGLQNE